ncbi:serine protease Do [Desulfobaculum xiamenense]|uniref:Probable periplasmic serine endoprotease DegP-like n=1 Tax=Desulfobaculum xiamenense TaxID=995050 RepID=A0A846QJC6_9BACT|nr:DegQ family serine endoprotease [Desulfobaculum xiamenense]NJB66582.1 serine protease Do [Desulfobaculum xiamenense]
MPRILALALALVIAASQAAAAALPEFTDLAEKAGGAVVNISTVKIVKREDQMQEFFRFHKRGTPFDDFFEQFDRYFQQRPDQRPRKERSLGSGFIISDDGFIVTNNHVIANADEVSVNLQGGQKPYPAEIIGRDPDTDLALLKIKTDAKLPTLAFGDSDSTKVGQWVVAIGNPFGLDHTVTAGIVSAKGRIIGSGPFDDFIQTDASINPGNSGGPLLNMNGDVVGINTAIVASGQGIGFAIPSNMAKKVIAQLKDNQKVSRGWLGVTIQDVDENTAKALELDSPRGALIASVLPGQPAEKSGVKAGDVIIRIEKDDIKDANALLRRIAGLAPGEKIDVTVWRSGREKKLRVTLGERETRELAQAEQPDEAQPEAALGLALRPVDPREAQALGMDSPQGLLVTGVAEGSPAQDGEIRPGDVIIQANQQLVNSVAEFKTILSGDAMKKGVLLLLIQRQGQSVFRTITLPAE